MTTDHSKAAHKLRESAYLIEALPGAEDHADEVAAYRAAANALEALSAERTITINDAAIEAGSRALAALYEGKDRWYRDAESGVNACTVEGILEAAYAAQTPEEDSTDEH